MKKRAGNSDALGNLLAFYCTMTVPVICAP